MGILTSLFGTQHERTISALRPLVALVNGFEPTLALLSDSALASKTVEFRLRLEGGESLDALLPEAFAVVREAAKRTLGQRHYDVQLLGGMILHRSGIAEMRTGEGKTLVATLPVYLNALTGKGVHVVTVNDYLSRRDAVWMGQVYAFLGLTIGVINHESSYLYDRTQGEPELDEERDGVGAYKVMYEFLRPCSRRDAYGADITYGTNNEYGFDYLRDNIAYEEPQLVQREHNFAIVDEVDSILIDEARTPLIISAPANESESLYQTFTEIASQLKEVEDYTIDEKLKAIQLTDSGITKAETALGVENIYTEGGIKFVHHLETAVRAKALFALDREYVVRDGEVVIVDEFTGRLQPGRRWSDGLHQAIESKEGVAVQRESRTMASITFQNYFKMYAKIGGMTGTAITSAEEFMRIYGLDTVPVPPNRTALRIDRNDLIYQTEQGKFAAVASKVKEVHERGQPVLIGTVSIEKNELLSAYLKREGVPHEVLNAKNHEREGEIIAQAGRPGSVVIATNMAGRGVDIKLGGVPATETDEKLVRDSGGLFVLGTERHEARRIDNQLRGRAGRQGDPGETQFFVSLEDSLMRVFASDTIKSLMGRFGIPEDQPIENGMITRALESAQTKIEGFHFDGRKHVLQFDNVINHQRQAMYARRRKILMGNSEDIKQYLDEILDGAGEAGENVRAKIAEQVVLIGEDQLFAIIRRIGLQANDMFWVDHLELMDYARSSVNLRAYGQRDPLVEYKNEALRLYKEMEEGIQHRILEMISNIVINVVPQEPIPAITIDAERMASEIVLSGGSSESVDAGKPVALAQHQHQESDSYTPESAEGELTRVGRNDPCPCGSGKKYKKCHGV